MIFIVTKVQRTHSRVYSWYRISISYISRRQKVHIFSIHFRFISWKANYIMKKKILRKLSIINTCMTKTLFEIFTFFLTNHICKNYQSNFSSGNKRVRSAWPTKVMGYSFPFTMPATKECEGNLWKVHKGSMCSIVTA